MSLLLSLLIATCPAGAEELNCLTDAERQEGGLYRQLQQTAYRALDARDAAFEKLDTADAIRRRQAELRELFLKQIGGLPDRTPLNPRTVRTIEADGYRIECIVFESQPRHHVTANLYLPASDKPVPGVVVSSGHSRTGKTADYNQRFGIMMARQGMAALCFDPIGQGERSQILKADGTPRFGSTTTEHFLIGVGSTLVGRSTARYRIWDAIRAIDYLSERPEVDADRVGFTGCSGGGTMTSYVMALDDRVRCAAPACYLTTFRRLIETIGPQDAEQNVYGQLSFGMDHPDYVLMRAPRPTLISSTTGDFFDIRGSWENFRQAKRVYGVFGFPERVDLVEVAGGHGVQPQNLASIAQWMRRWLCEVDEPVSAVVLPVRRPEQLHCCSTAQVLMEFADERSVFDLNAEYAAELGQRRNQRSAEEMRAAIRAVLRLRDDAKLEEPDFEDRGRVTRDGYHVDRLVLRNGSGTPIPGLTYHPESPDDDAYLYLHDRGKVADAEAGGPIRELLGDGYAVVAVDLRGQGETRTDKPDAVLTGWKTYYLAYLLGKPLLGMRVEDAISAGDFVAHYQKERDDPRKVHLVGTGQAGVIALHAAALRPDLFTSVTLRDTPKDWSSLVAVNAPGGHLDSAVHGALEVYDLPDLVKLAGADKVRFED